MNVTVLTVSLKPTRFIDTQIQPGKIIVTLRHYTSKLLHWGLGFSLLCIAPWATAETTAIQSNNLILRNTVIQSVNSASIKAEGRFINTAIQGGEYNTAGVTATGVSVSLSNSQSSGKAETNSSSMSISGMNIKAQNTGSTSATAVFQGNSLAGNHNSMVVQASGTSIVLSNVKR